jgi:hypothetical protein
MPYSNTPPQFLVPDLYANNNAKATTSAAANIILKHHKKNVLMKTC